MLNTAPISKTEWVNAHRHYVGAAALIAVILLWFSPVIFGSMVFSSDGQSAAFEMGLGFWSEALYAGFPVLADPNFSNAYPVRLLFKSLIGLTGKSLGYNLYIISSLAITALGMYAYVARITGSSGAGILAGLSFTLSGFVLGHVGHDSMLHTIAWLPALIYCVHRCTEMPSWKWTVLGGLVVAVAILANHPQILLYGLLVSSGYALFLGGPGPRLRAATMGCVSGMATLGAALTAWQLMVSAELMGLSLRNALTREEFLEGAIPLEQFVSLFFPWIFFEEAGSHLSYFGSGWYAEAQMWMAPASILLAGLAVALRMRCRLTQFWLLVVFVGLVLSVGGATPLGNATYHVPVLNLFRIPGRHLAEVSLAVGVLAGLGWVALLTADRVRVKRALFLVGISLPIVAFAALSVSYGAVAAAAKGGVTWDLLDQNGPVWGSAAIWTVSLFALALCLRIDARFRVPSALAVLIMGSAYFTWFMPWRESPTPRELFESGGSEVAELRKITSGGGRIVAPDGWLAPYGIGPNASAMFGFESVGGYGPLLRRRLAQHVLLTNGGWIRPEAFRAQDRGLDLLNVRWLVWDSRQAFPATIEKFGIVWQRDSLSIEAGTRCDGTSVPGTPPVTLPTPVVAYKLAIVSSIGCGAGLAAGADSLVVELRGPDYASQTVLRTGIDTAEFALGCKEIARESRHGPGRVFETVANGHRSCHGQYYLAVIDVPPGPISEIHVSYAASSGFGRIEKLSLLGADGSTLAALGEDSESSALQEPRWRYSGSFSHFLVLENLRVLPKAWIVGSVARVGSDEEELAILRGERMLDGRPFDPLRTAFTVDAAALTEVPGESQVEIQQWLPGSVSLNVVTSRSALVIVSAQYYPGWVATIAGATVPLYRVNHTLIGIPVPPGTHRIDLSFAPRLFWWGCAVSIATLVGILGLFAIKRHRSRPESDRTALR